MAQSQGEGSDLVNGVNPDADAGDAEEVVDEITKMLQQTRILPCSTSGGGGANGVGSGVRASRSNPVYVSLPTDDSLSAEILNIKNGSLPLHARRQSCSHTACDHLKDIICQYYKQLFLLLIFGVTGGIFLGFSRQYVFKAIDVLKKVDVALQCFLFLRKFVTSSTLDIVFPVVFFDRLPHQ